MLINAKRLHRVLLCAATTLLSGALVTACGSSGGKKSGGNNAAAGDDSADGTGTKKKSGSSTGDGGDGEKDSLALFKETVYPVVQAHCAGCHNTLTSPFFAADDASEAHEAVTVSRKVNFDDPASSRLVLRLSEDKHYCWADCDANAEEMRAAIQQWADGVKGMADQQKNTVATTSALLLSQAEKATIEFKNPANVFVLEAEKGTLKAPMAVRADPARSGGNVIQTPAGAGNQVNATTARTQATLGTVTFTFNVTQAGNYQLWGFVNAPAAANASFYVNMDAAAALTPWLFGATGADYKWDLSDTVAGTGTPTQFNLTAGAHTLEIRQRQEQAKIDMIVLTSDTMFDPMTAKPDGSSEVQVLNFDISQQSGVPGAKFQVEVKDFSENGYLFKNPKIIADKPIHVKDVRLLVNGEFLAQHATWTIIDKTAAAGGDVLSPAALVALKDKGAEVDEFSFSFAAIEEAK